MKRILRPLLLLAALAALLSISVFAEDEVQYGTGFYDIEKVDGVTVTPDSTQKIDVIWGTDSTVEETSSLYLNSEKLTVQLAGLQPAGHYIVIFTTAEQIIGDAEDPGISAENIYYINQVDIDSAGTVTFTVFPRQMAANGERKDMNLFIFSSTDTSRKVALSYANNAPYVEPMYTLGDIDSNGKWNAADALLALQIGAGTLADVTETQKKAADVDRNGKYNATDALYILQKGAGTLTEWPNG